MTTTTISERKLPSVPSKRRRASEATIHDFHEQLHLAGLKEEFSDRGPAGGYLALDNGMPVSEVVECLVRNRSEMFSTRQRKKRLRASAR